MFNFVWKHHAGLAHQVQSVLAKLELCRTKALGRAQVSLSKL